MRRKRVKQNIHAINQRIHAKNRIFQRYGITLNQKTYYTLIKQIQTNKAIFVGRETPSRTKWIVSYNENQFPVIYDSNKHTIVTFLPA